MQKHFNIHKIGVSHIEVGTITPKTQFGNPKPRIFRLYEDQAIINSLGFSQQRLGICFKSIKK